ncbi:hypothetical protein BH23BAC1_BH23BAC1_08120 [soil metagenome]
MFIPFEEIPPASRIWIYQADRKLSKAEVEEINKRATNFLKEWAAHGNQLACSAKIFHDQFLIITVNEDFNLPSGCSIDSSISFIRTLESDFILSFLDRSKVAFIINDQVYLESVPNLKKKISEGFIKEDTPVFNNLINKKIELENKWIVPAKNSWLNKYFRQK